MLVFNLALLQDAQYTQKLKVMNRCENIFLRKLESVNTTTFAVGIYIWCCVFDLLCIYLHLI